MTFDIKEFLTENKTTINEDHGSVSGYAGTAFEQLRDVENLLHQGKSAAEGGTDGALSRGLAKLFDGALKHVVTAQKLMTAADQVARKQR